MEYENKMTTVSLSVDQKAAIAHGRGQWGTVTGAIAIDRLTEGQRAELVTLNLSKPLNEQYNGAKPIDLWTAGDTDDEFVGHVISVLMGRMACRAERARQDDERHERDVARLLETPPDELILDNGYSEPDIRVVHPESIRSDERVVAYLRPIREQVERMRAAWQERKRHREAQQERDSAADREVQRQAEQAFAEMLRTQILRDDDTDRFQRGLMATSEQLDHAREWVFGGIDRPRYQRLRHGDVEHDEDCYSEEVEWDTPEGTNANLTAAEFTALRDIEALVEQQNRRPEFEVAGITITADPREHVGECERCDARVRRGAVLLRATVGPHRVSREFALGE
jgi:hypothetical protein